MNFDSVFYDNIRLVEHTHVGKMARGPITRMPLFSRNPMGLYASIISSATS